MIKLSVLCFLILIGSDCKRRPESKSKEASHGKEDVLKILPGINNPRNSEGDFITLKDGRILYIYTHYTCTSENDHASAYLAGRYFSDNGNTWSESDIKIVDQEGTMKYNSAIAKYDIISFHVLN